MSIETTILANLLENEKFSRAAAPYVQEDYFSNFPERLTFKLIYDHIDKYGSLPSKNALLISLDNQNISEDHFKETKNLIRELKVDDKDDYEWLLKETEKFCQDKAIYNAIKDSISIIDGEDKNRDKGCLPELLSNALAVSFDTNVGHDFVDNSDDRWEFYHSKEDKIPFDLDHFNKVTKGGVSRKAIAIILAETGGGKSMLMCHMAAANLSMGYNVLYITAEMAEEKIAERIDANLLDIKLDDIRKLSEQQYKRRIEAFKKTTKGRLVIKEYPTASANVNHFRYLINELRLKKNFKPDVIYVDYMNICASSRIKLGGSVNTYSYVKAITEELRGLAVENNVALITATQVNRDGFGNADPEMTSISESIGTTYTADFLCAIINNDDLRDQGQIMIKQLKNRWGDIANPSKFAIGVEWDKMRCSNVNTNAQNMSLGTATTIQRTRSKFSEAFDDA